MTETSGLTLGGRSKRYLKWEKPAALVDRYRRAEVNERLDEKGSILIALDPTEVERVLDRLLAEGISTLAVCLLHSCVNPAHERQIRDIARRKAPDLLVCISSDVLPEIKEYERTSTTVINVYVLPVVQQYCSRLRTDLNRLGVTAPLHIMQSNHRTRPLPLSPACRSMRYVLNSRKGQAAKALLLSIPG